VARQVIITAQAEGHIRAIEAWWRRNRTDSPGLFARELGEAFSTLEVAPESGSRYSHPEVKAVRRIHLSSTRHHVYYLTGIEAVVVLAVWGSVKGSKPSL
jgi:plasmid stabilization system protein ParE